MAETTAFRFIGCAGWTVPKPQRSAEKLHHLQDYARYFNAVEINSSFYRNHKLSTYSSWANLVPENFRFAAKLPKLVSHETKFTQPELISPFLDGIALLGKKCGPVLMQTPPKQEFAKASVEKFLQYLRSRFQGSLVCEPRHASWFNEPAAKILQNFGVSYVLADPSHEDIFMSEWRHRDPIYIRLHGKPKIYYSEYDPEFLSVLTKKINQSGSAAGMWVIFDNTALGHAFQNAMELIGNHLSCIPSVDGNQK